MQKNSKQGWKEKLPEVFHWVESLNFTSIQDTEKSAHHIVGVRSDSEDPSAYEIDAPSLSKTIKDKIKNYCSSFGWRPRQGVLSVCVEECWFILVPTSSLNVEASQKARQLGMDAGNYLRSLEVKTAILCSSSELSTLDMWEGFAHSYYSLESFKASGNGSFTFPEKVKFLSEEHGPEKEEAYKATVCGSLITRALCDSPPNWLNSEKFAELAVAMANELGIRCEIKGKKDLEELGMGSFLSVAKGTSIEPKLIVFEIEGKNPDKKVALIGKGLTFDAGGISLKPSAGMDQMKYDMCGGGAVFGTAYALSKIKPQTNVVCMIGAVENMPYNEATRPGDVVTAMNGKTVEILNTDAEGRLVLIDLLHYAEIKYKPEMMIDIATLTGAVIIALGHVGSGMMTNSEKLAEYMKEQTKKIGEPLWHLPMWPELDKEVKSVAADFKNITVNSVGAKSLSAGSFLKAFVKDTPWAHLDIAGTAWDCRATGYPSSGSSAFGMKTLLHAALNFRGLD